ncbi:hypothetical protein PIB30_085519 [Stylosanthes scabra]|uniref:Uncharacterized protein n=1 Tax=Stylosanthes scabra TaxID=79078 RepID=A0ABU6VTV3_9FABA|nr:hypothetical protein [Stylosanthes scabra]
MREAQKRTESQLTQLTEMLQKICQPNNYQPTDSSPIFDLKSITVSPLQTPKEALTWFMLKGTIEGRIKLRMKKGRMTGCMNYWLNWQIQINLTMKKKLKAKMKKKWRKRLKVKSKKKMRRRSVRKMTKGRRSS